MRQLACFPAALLAISLPYWPTPYGRLNLPDALIGPGLSLLGVALGAVLDRLWRHTAGRSDRT